MRTWKKAAGDTRKESSWMRSSIWGGPFSHVSAPEAIVSPGPSTTSTASERAIGGESGGDESALSSSCTSALATSLEGAAEACTETTSSIAGAAAASAASAAAASAASASAAVSAASAAAAAAAAAALCRGGLNACRASSQALSSTQQSNTKGKLLQ